MVGVILSFGRSLGTVWGFEFPMIERLAMVTETELREAVFGYRAKYTVGTVKAQVWKIATHYLLPELAGKRLTLKFCSQVSDAFVSKFWKYADVLFIGELPSQKGLVATVDKTKPAKRKRRRSKVTIEVVLQMDLGICPLGRVESSCSNSLNIVSKF